MIVAHCGQELPAVVTALSGGVGAVSVAGAVVRDRIREWVQRLRRQ